MDRDKPDTNRDSSEQTGRNGAEVAKAASQVEKSPAVLGRFFDALPTRFRVLLLCAFLGIGGAGTGAVVLKACNGAETVDLQKDPVLLSHREGSWNFKMYRTSETTVTNEHGKFLYHFIKGYLEKNNLFPGDLSEKERENVIDAIIHFCRRLNTQNLDDFSSIANQKIYFPEHMLLENPEKGNRILELKFHNTPQKDKELLELLKGQADGNSFEALDQDLNRVLENLAEDHETHRSEEAWQGLLAFNKLMEATGARDYYEVYTKYNLASSAEMEPYLNQTASNILEKITKLERSTDGKDRHEELIKLNRILRTKMYEELFDILENLHPQQVREIRFFKGTVLDSPSRIGFYDLLATWEWKKEHKSRREDASVYDAIIEDLGQKDNPVTMKEWLSGQELACAYFRRHGEELGYNVELVKYMTPAIILSVVHAEFFSELSGGAYMDILPAAFESANLAYGPAVNDNKVSAGVVQMIQSTFEALLDSKGTKLRELQASDPDYHFIIPDNAKPIRVGRKTLLERNPQQIAEAMVTDLPSQSFYAILAVAYHIEMGFNTLMKDTAFVKAWDEAIEEEKYLFMASFSAMAINHGRGGLDRRGRPTGTYAAALSLLEIVDASSLTPYITSLPEAAKGQTRKRGAEVGLQAMQEMLDRAHRLEKVSAVTQASTAPIGPPVPKVETEPPLPRSPILRDYGPMRERATADGFALSTDKRNNRRLYEATVGSPDAVDVPSVHDLFFHKPDKNTVARMAKTAYEIFVDLAREFKEKTGGYTLSYTDVLRTPEYNDKVSPIDDSTHFTGRTIDIPDGRFKDPNGKEITWSLPGGKGRGPDADVIETKLRPALVRLFEENIAAGRILVFDETHGGGHYHLYIPKTRSGQLTGF